MADISQTNGLPPPDSLSCAQKWGSRMSIGGSIVFCITTLVMAILLYNQVLTSSAPFSLQNVLIGGTVLTTGCVVSALLFRYCGGDNASTHSSTSTSSSNQTNPLVHPQRGRGPGNRPGTGSR